MCDNAMVYNRPETVYYKAAKKLLHTGFKMMSKVKTVKSLCYIDYKLFINKHVLFLFMVTSQLYGCRIGYWF